MDTLLAESSIDPSLNQVRETNWITKLFKWRLHLEKIKKVKPKALIYWLYSVSYFIVLGITSALCSAIPVDLIIQSFQTSSRIAINTLIIIGACALFVLSAFVLYLVRVLINRAHLQDIPRIYIPVSSADITEPVSDYIHEELIRCQRISKTAGPKGIIFHDGMYHEQKGTSSKMTVLPNDLVYDNVVCDIGQEVKYRGKIQLSESRFIVPKNKCTLKELILDEYDEMTDKLNDYELTTMKDMVGLYEKLRFSGKPITHHEFERFLRLWSQVEKTLVNEK